MPKYLFVVASTCQMYSGTGTALFDWIRYAKADFQFSVLMDVQISENFNIMAKFCREHDLPLHGSLPLNMPGCSDSGVKSIAMHLHRHRYDYIECISWANSSTNLSVLAALPPHTALIFTPHSQPIWTLSNHSNNFMVSEIFRRMLKSADAVFIDSPSEKNFLEFSSINPRKLHFVPLGVNTKIFRNTDSHVPYTVSCVCDCRESRKRIDLLLAAFTMAHEREPRLKLILAGKDSDRVSIPKNLSSSVRQLGYISQNELVDLYQSSALFALLSEYEAFGLPIAEALCCGTPVLLNRQEGLIEIFKEMPGVNWTENADIELTADKITTLANGDFDFQNICQAASSRFAFENTYGKKRDLVLNI